MLMQLEELRYRANMSSDPIWEKRYRAALQYDLPNPVDLDLVNRILGGPVGFWTAAAEADETVVSEVKNQTWRDRPAMI